MFKYDAEYDKQSPKNLRMQNHWINVVRTAITTMETKSPYFSPKKTRNFSKQHGKTLLQKVTDQSSKITEDTKPKAGRVAKTNPEPNTVACESRKGRKRNIRIDANAFAEVKIKVESLEEAIPQVRSAIDVKTPVKRELTEEHSPVKDEPVAERGFSAETVKETKWEPVNWRQTLENIRQMRRDTPAPVDTMGCDQFALDVENKIPAREKRFHCLVSLMLSSQTKDAVNHECMTRLKKHGLTPESIIATDADVLEKLIYPVSFYKNKTKFIKRVSQILIDQYGGDIPDNIEGLLKLPGVGKKMAHLCMGSAWNIVTGIGVDTHVHRITNWLRWVPQETKTPEDTRVALEKWLPFELWDEVNHLLVGFGQTICTSTYPRCNDCVNAPICPARGKHGIRKTPIKKEIKAEDLEF
ncbi:endonuclease III-like protein 1 [Anopheles bellator]|uniref:endonuclease III-like protein 1 n=1 Tax=Anopheles bellator TaxID=139047 RepID=UPI002648F0FC|nr:endonuclease III-like protein 1 [Anopheles bellator]